jgi:hypothetical protein
MKKLILLTTAGVLAAGTVQASFAASRLSRADLSQGTELMDSVRRDYYSVYGNNSGFNSYARGETPTFQAAPLESYPAHNLPYPDRPWGAPDRH